MTCEASRSGAGTVNKGKVAFHFAMATPKGCLVAPADD